MKEEIIKVVKKWPESKSVQEIQIFIIFANFYWRFIYSFSTISATLITVLKTTKSSVLLVFGANDNEVINKNAGDSDNNGSDDGSNALEQKLIKSKSQNQSRNLVHSGNSKTIKDPKLLISKA